MSIRVTGLTKRFGAFTALGGVDLHIPDGELVALLGPSGSGKTTLLRIIAGLETADAGTVELAGTDATRTSPQRRRVGFVFQHYALFRHLTVLDNIAFGPRSRPRAERPDDAVIRARAHDLLRQVQLDGYADRRPHQLSGGQRQRVALARALAVEPRVLLLDEPFGALDAKVRRELRTWLRRLHTEVGLTTVFVTHDQEEALEVADRVVVFNQGRIEQVGTPAEVYDRPATPFVHHFLGQVNIFAGRAVAGHAKVGDLVVAPSWDRAVAAEGDVRVFVRPHDIEISRRRDPICLIPATIAQLIPTGPSTRLELLRSDDGSRVAAEIPHERRIDLDLRRGDAVFIGFTRYEVYDRPLDFQI
jgi:sulfate transport system ATP-binding protein